MRRRKKKRRAIILIGFMGCGKTSVGLRLSYRLRCGIQDTDKMIEAREGRTISEIFAREGEAYFRTLETELLKELAGKEYHQILSVGGGTPLKKENRRLLHKIGTVVWLRIQPATVYERLKGDVTRPLLQGEHPLERITELIGQRSAAYSEAADVIIDVDGLDMEAALEQIVKALKEHKSENSRGRQKEKRWQMQQETLIKKQ